MIKNYSEWSASQNKRGTHVGYIGYLTTELERLEAEKAIIFDSYAVYQRAKYLAEDNNNEVPSTSAVATVLDTVAHMMRELGE